MVLQDIKRTYQMCLKNELSRANRIAVEQPNITVVVAIFRKAIQSEEPLGRIF